MPRHGCRQWALSQLQHLCRCFWYSCSSARALYAARRGCRAMEQKLRQRLRRRYWPPALASLRLSRHTLRCRALLRKRARAEQRDRARAAADAPRRRRKRPAARSLAAALPVVAGAPLPLLPCPSRTPPQHDEGAGCQQQGRSGACLAHQAGLPRLWSRESPAARHRGPAMAGLALAAQRCSCPIDAANAPIHGACTAATAGPG